MTEERPREENDPGQNEFSKQIGNKEERKLRARREKKYSIWFWMGMFGLVGWSVMIPTLLFIALGVWIDKNFESSYSWTLMLLVIGIITGCLNAWYWVKKEMNER